MYKENINRSFGSKIFTNSKTAVVLWRKDPFLLDFTAVFEIVVFLKNGLAIIKQICLSMPLENAIFV